MSTASSSAVSISPFGEVHDLALVSHGPMSNVYSGILGGEDVCIKVPSDRPIIEVPSRGEDRATAPTRPVFAVGSVNEISTTTVYFYNVEFGDDDFVPEGLAAAALVAEAHSLAVSGDHWNHEPFGLGCLIDIDGGHTLARSRMSDRIVTALWSEPALLPALVMPSHDARPLSSFPRAEQNRQFKLFLPALWRALTALPHGDLKPGHILIDEGRGIAHIIDPGVTVDWREPNGGNRRVFTTNLAHYPVLLPRFGPGTASEWQGPLVEILRGHPTSSDPPGAPPAGTEVGPNVTSGAGARPSAADIMALGIIHYRILTGLELAERLDALMVSQTMDDDRAAERTYTPLWRYSIGAGQSAATNRVGVDSLRHAIENGRLAAMLSDADNLLDDAEWQAADRAICSRLVHLDIEDEAQLVDLVAGRA